MKPFKKILVPVDFSTHAAEAVRAAADLARRYEAAITLVHVLEQPSATVPDGFLFYMPDQFEKLQAEYEKLLANTKHDAEAAGAPQVTTQHLQGVTASEIAQFARKGGFDLIVMGTHGRTGIQHALIGSVAEKVLRKAPCPVLAVKAVDTAR